MKDDSREIQLEGSKLTEFSDLAARIEKDVLHHADQILHELYGEEKGKYDIKSVRIFPNNTRIAILDARCKVIGVWEKPPGTCRLPRRGETFD